MTVREPLRVLALAALLLAGVPLRADPPAGAQAPAPPLDACAAAPGAVAEGTAQWNGWGRDLDNSRYQPEPALRAADVPKLQLRWAFGYPGSAVSGQPTVVDGRLFVASAIGRIYALDARTGCTYWTYEAPAAVHTPIAIGQFAPAHPAPAPRAQAGAVTKHKSHRKNGRKRADRRTLTHLDLVKAPSTAFFGDDTGTVYALDAQTGALRWKTQVETHPLARILAAPTVFRDRLYVAVSSAEQGAAANPGYVCCTSRGSVVALDLVTGRLLWKTYLVAQEPRAVPPSGGAAPGFAPAGVPVRAAVSVDAARGLLYVATGSALTAGDAPLADAIVALGQDDGAVRWSRRFGRDAEPRSEESLQAGFSSAPILRALPGGKSLLIAAQRSGFVYGLDPDRGGEVLWRVRAADGALGGIEWGPAADHRNLYVPLSGLVEDPAGSTGGPGGTGGLVALDLKTGTRRWQTPAPTPECAWGPHGCSHAESQAATVIPGAVFSGSMDGHLRAYSTIDGRITWDFPTAADFTTRNGVKASGGSLDRGGPIVVDGMVYVNSGYVQRIGQPGNVLLAFSVQGK